MTSSITSRLGISPEEGIKAPVRATSTTNITLSGTQTIAGVALVAGDRCLVAGQTDATENGIYVVAAGAWVRKDELVNGAVVVDDAAGILYQASFTGSYVPGTTSVTFGSVDDTVETYTGKVLVVADHTVTTAASGSLVATELNAALAELDADITAVADTAASAVTSKIGASGVNYENLDANGDIGFSAGQVPAGDLVIPTSKVGVEAGQAVTVDQAVTATTRAATTVLGTSLNHTLSDTGLNITAFNGVAGVTYHCRALGTGRIVHRVTNLPASDDSFAGLTEGIFIMQGWDDIITQTGDTFDVEMITGTTCRIKNYVRDNGSTVRAPDVPVFRAHAVGPTTLTGGGGVYDKILLQSVDFDESEDFYTSTSRFIPRVAGYYHIIGSVTYETPSYFVATRLYKNGSALVEGGPFAIGGRAQIEDVISMNGTTDYLELWAHSLTSQDVLDSPALTFMTGFLIRRA